MNIAIIVAGGSGKRMVSSDIPKQFIEIKNKPILIHTIEKFIANENVDLIIIPCKNDWVDFTKDICKKYFNLDKKIYVINGGISRNQSILKAYEFINENLKVSDQDVILTHDAVRMFVTDAIINNNINAAIKNNIVVDTCVKTIDTVICSNDGESIDTIPNRDILYNGQTPQSCNFALFKKIYDHQYDKNIFNTTDLCKLAELMKIKINIVPGDYYNFKITTDFDLLLAKVLLEKHE